MLPTYVPAFSETRPDETLTDFGARLQAESGLPPVVLALMGVALCRLVLGRQVPAGCADQLRQVERSAWAGRLFLARTDEFKAWFRPPVSDVDWNGVLGRPLSRTLGALEKSPARFLAAAAGMPGHADTVLAAAAAVLQKRKGLRGPAARNEVRKFVSLFVPPDGADEFVTEQVRGLSDKWVEYHLAGSEPADLGSLPILADALQEAGLDEVGPDGWRLRWLREGGKAIPGWPVVPHKEST